MLRIIMWGFEHLYGSNGQKINMLNRGFHIGRAIVHISNIKGIHPLFPAVTCILRYVRTNTISHFSNFCKLLNSFYLFLNASKYCGTVIKNDFVVADELLSYFQRIWLLLKYSQNLNLSKTEFFSELCRVDLIIDVS